MTALQLNIVTALVDQAKDTGVKDTFAQSIIENLVKLGQQLRKASPDHAAHTPDEVQAILTKELRDAYAKGGVMNALLTMEGYLL